MKTRPHSRSTRAVTQAAVAVAVAAAAANHPARNGATRSAFSVWRLLGQRHRDSSPRSFHEIASQQEVMGGDILN